MSNEQILREALAFILSQNSADSGSRAIAHKTLKSLYGDAIPGKSVKEFDQWVSTEMRRLVDEVIQDVKKNNMEAQNVGI